MGHIPELERMKSLQYQDAKEFIEENPPVRSLLDRLRDECPNVDERNLLSIFHLRNEELITATAHRLEYNATHRPDGTSDGTPRRPE